MESTNFWLAVWKIIAISVCVIIVSVGGCQSYQNHQIQLMVAGGAEPMKAACAITPQMTDRVLCASVVAK